MDDVLKLAPILGTSGLLVLLGIGIVRLFNAVVNWFKAQTDTLGGMVEVINKQGEINGRLMTANEINARAQTEQSATLKDIQKSVANTETSNASIAASNQSVANESKRTADRQQEIVDGFKAFNNDTSTAIGESAKQITAEVTKGNEAVLADTQLIINSIADVNTKLDGLPAEVALALATDFGKLIEKLTSIQETIGEVKQAALAAYNHARITGGHETPAMGTPMVPAAITATSGLPDAMKGGPDVLTAMEAKS